MLALKVEKKRAQTAKEWLVQKGILASGVKALRDDAYVYFAVTKKTETPFDASFTQKTFEATPTVPSFRKALEDRLGKKLAEAATASFDTIGETAIIEVRDEHKTWAKKIASALLDSNPKIKTVLGKASAMQGEYRVRKLVWLAGKKTFDVTYRESGCVMAFDLRKTYFSTRLSFERGRIASKVKPRENVLALFAGVGPFALVIAKKQPACHVVAIELNPYAAKTMQENVQRNHAQNVTAIQGDVRKVLKDYAQWADRVTMPLPHTGHDFLQDAISATKSGGVIHFYGFGGEKEGVYRNALSSIRRAGQKTKVKCRVLEKRVVRPYAPSVYQVVVDFKVTR
ncbi:class I SAM-dependent methyltransferase family protein [Candidatus Micrarchaeota archaeon]|nr:class I SAM-dependent methyltransferase family protein [Candidatus Micrarchaeota archaeon]